MGRNRAATKVSNRLITVRHGGVMAQQQQAQQQQQTQQQQTQLPAAPMGRRADDRRMSKKDDDAVVMEQPSRKVGLVFYFYRVLSEKGQSLAELDRTGIAKAASLAKAIVATALDRQLLFREFFTNDLTGEVGNTKLQSSGSNQYICRMYLKSFPLIDSFEAIIGLSHGVTPGKALLQLSSRLGRVERMQVKAVWKALMDSYDCLSPVKILPWFSQGIQDTVALVNNSADDPYNGRLSFSVTKTGPEVELKSDNADAASIRLIFILSVKGQGCPSGIRVQHPLPKLLPYSMQGKETIENVSDSLIDGQSMYNLDMQMPTSNELETYWNLNFLPLSERVMTSAKSFRNSNVIDPCLNVLRIIASEKLWNIPTDILQTTVLWEFKKNAARVRNESELFMATLNRLAKYMSSTSCPHFLLPNINMLKAEDRSWCQHVGKELHALHEKLSSDPDYLLECTGCKKQRVRGDDKPY